MWIFIRVSTNSYIKASARALGEATPGAPGAVRTRDPLLKRQVLIYQLSYRRISTRWSVGSLTYLICICLRGFTSLPLGGDIQNRTEDERLQSSRFTIKLYRQISFPRIRTSQRLLLRYNASTLNYPGSAPETMDPVTGIGPVSFAGKANILPLNYTEIYK